VRELFRHYRRQLEDGQLSAEASALQTRLTASSEQMLATIRAAYADTPSMRTNRRTWDSLRVNTRALGYALELWRESIDDVRRLDPEGLLPGLEHAIDTLDGRLARIEYLWRERADGENPRDQESIDHAMLAPLKMDIATSSDRTQFERAVILGFVQQLNTLDLITGDLLRTMRALAELEPARDLDDPALPSDLFRPSRWDPLRLANALFPALCFAAAYFFWIFFDPPTGPQVPSMAATLGLLVLMSPMNALSMLPTLLGVIWIVVAPVYFLVMPRLDIGLELLTLIFFYSFLASLIGISRPTIKLWLLALFVMMTGISNDQVYSFTGLVDGAFMFVLALGIVAAMQMLLGPVRPEQILLSSVRRFFQGCARITGEFAHPQPKNLARGKALRKRYYESMILPEPKRLQAAEKKLDYQRFPDNSMEKVQGLHDAMQSIMIRFQALELAYSRVARSSTAWNEPLALLGQQLKDRVQRLFEKWSRFERTDALAERDALNDLAHGLEAQLDVIYRTHAQQLDNQSLADLFALLGCARGLIHAAAVTQDAVNQINWDQWAEARF
jgi:hypothetical protein